MIDYDEEPTLGQCWHEFDLDARVEQRIACDERGYPYSEALYESVAEWEAANNMNWYVFLNV